MDAGLRNHLAAIVVDDATAKHWLFDRFAGRLSRKLELRYGASGYELEDLLHDAFVFFFQHNARVLAVFLERHQSDPIMEEALERYLWDLTGGLVANRRRANRKTRFEELDTRQLSSREPTAERAVLSREAVSLLADCIRERSPRLLLYSRLRYFDGLEPEEIAEVTGWSRKTTYKLKAALTSALQGCREALGLGAR